jgi:hypothetical protein
MNAAVEGGAGGENWRKLKHRGKAVERVACAIGLAVLCLGFFVFPASFFSYIDFTNF